MAAPHLQHVSPGQWITHQVPTSYGSAATVSPRGTTWRATERHRGTAGIIVKKGAVGEAKKVSCGDNKKKDP